MQAWFCLLPFSRHLQLSPGCSFYHVSNGRSLLHWSLVLDGGLDSTQTQNAHWNLVAAAFTIGRGDNSRHSSGSAAACASCQLDFMSVKPASWNYRQFFCSLPLKRGPAVSVQPAGVDGNELRCFSALSLTHAHTYIQLSVTVTTMTLLTLQDMKKTKL